MQQSQAQVGIEKGVHGFRWFMELWVLGQANNVLNYH